MSELNNHVIVQSHHSGAFEQDGHKVDVSIFKLDAELEWTLEVTDQDGVLNELFVSDEVAWRAFLKIVEEEGLASLIKS